MAALSACDACRIAASLEWKKPSSARVWMLALWIVAGGALICSAEPLAPTAYEVQAAFLFNLTKFITWPEDSFQRRETLLVIGILGDDSFAAALEETLRDKKVRFRGCADAGWSPAHYLLKLGKEGESKYKMSQIVLTCLLSLNLSIYS